MQNFLGVTADQLATSAGIETTSEVMGQTVWDTTHRLMGQRILTLSNC